MMSMQLSEPPMREAVAPAPVRRGTVAGEGRPSGERSLARTQDEINDALFVHVPMYKINLDLTNRGKMWASSKRRIRWTFGYANEDSLARGLRGYACRGEEHLVDFEWSLTSGKRRISVDGNVIYERHGNSSNEQLGDNGSVVSGGIATCSSLESSVCYQFRHDFTLPGKNHLISLKVLSSLGSLASAASSTCGSINSSHSSASAIHAPCVCLSFNGLPFDELPTLHQIRRDIFSLYVAVPRSIKETPSPNPLPVSSSSLSTRRNSLPGANRKTEEERVSTSSFHLRRASMSCGPEESLHSTMSSPALVTTPSSSSVVSSSSSATSSSSSSLSSSASKSSMSRKVIAVLRSKSKSDLQVTDEDNVAVHEKQRHRRSREKNKQKNKQKDKRKKKANEESAPEEEKAEEDMVLASRRQSRRSSAPSRMVEEAVASLEAELLIDARKRVVRFADEEKAREQHMQAEKAKLAMEETLASKKKKRTENRQHKSTEEFAISSSKRISDLDLLDSPSGAAAARAAIRSTNSCCSNEPSEPKGEQSPQDSSPRRSPEGRRRLVMLDEASVRRLLLEHQKDHNSSGGKARRRSSDVGVYMMGGVPSQASLEESSEMVGTQSAGVLVARQQRRRMSLDHTTELVGTVQSNKAEERPRRRMSLQRDDGDEKSNTITPDLLLGDALRIKERTSSARHLGSSSGSLNSSSGRGGSSSSQRSINNGMHSNISDTSNSSSSRLQGSIQGLEGGNARDGNESKASPRSRHSSIHGMQGGNSRESNESNSSFRSRRSSIHGMQGGKSHESSDSKASPRSRRRRSIGSVDTKPFVDHAQPSLSRSGQIFHTDDAVAAVAPPALVSPETEDIITAAAAAVANEISMERKREMDDEANDDGEVGQRVKKMEHHESQKEPVATSRRLGSTSRSRRRMSDLGLNSSQLVLLDEESLDDESVIGHFLLQERGPCRLLSPRRRYSMDDSFDDLSCSVGSFRKPSVVGTHVGAEGDEEVESIVTMELVPSLAEGRSKNTSSSSHSACDAGAPEQVFQTEDGTRVSMDDAMRFVDQWKATAPKYEKRRLEIAMKGTRPTKITTTSVMVLASDIEQTKAPKFEKRRMDIVQKQHQQQHQKNLNEKLNTSISEASRSTTNSSMHLSASSTGMAEEGSSGSSSSTRVSATAMLA